MENGDKPRWQCPSAKCGSYNVEQTNQGVFCADCGAVVEETAFDLSVSFTDNQDGSRTMTGQFVSNMCTTPYRFGGPGSVGFSRESRDVTIANGKKRIQQLAAALKLNHFVEAAHRLFLSAVQRNFVHGRKTSNVVAACLYIVCRQRNASHLLIDFSDVLQTNVYVLGNCFLKFRRLLNLELPAIDPVHYIDRFAAKLEFAEKTHEVAKTAHKLVARMKRDWIQTGRRPSGVCGAALILAARMHGFNRTQREVVNVMKICEETLRKRLVEFENTPSGNLTVEEFLQIDLPDEANPPAFTRNRLNEQNLIKKEAKRLRLEEGVESAELLSLEVSVVSDHGGDTNAPQPSASSSGTLEKGKRAENMAKRQQAQDAMYKSLEEELEASLKSFEEQQEDSTATEQDSSNDNDKIFGKGPDELPDENENENEDEIDARLEEKVRQQQQQQQQQQQTNQEDREEAEEEKGEVEKEKQDSYTDSPLLPNAPPTMISASSSTDSSRKKAPTVDEITKNIIANPLKLKQVPHRSDENLYREGNELLIQSTEAEDDALFKDEIDDMVLKPDESRMKKVLWTVQHKDFLEKERQDRIDGKQKRKRKRKPKGDAGASVTPGLEPSNATEPNKKVSKKIDQDAWNKLFGA